MIFSRGGGGNPRLLRSAAGGAPSPVPAKRSAAMQSAAEKIRRKQAKYICDLCGRDFTRRANLKSPSPPSLTPLLTTTAC